VNDVVLGALIGASSATGGAVIAQVGGFVLEKRRELASYRVNLYAKRLEVHQQAFEWTHRLNVDLNESKPGVLDAPETQRLNDTARSARAWWNGNALYLDPVSQSEFVYFLNLCFAYARDQLGPQEHIWKQMRVTQNVIVAGIGMKHIEEKKAKADG